MENFMSQPSTSAASQSHIMNDSDWQPEEDHTNEKIMTLKFDYMTLLDQANEISGYQNFRESLAKLDTVIDKATGMFSSVTDTSVMFMDAKVLHCTTSTLEQTTDSIDIGEGNFKLFPFAEQFKLKALNEEGRPFWEPLAAVAPPVIQNSIPYWNPLLGSFDYSAEIGSNTQRKVRHIRKKDEITEKKEPTKDPQANNAQEGVEKMVQRVYEKLKKHCRQQKKPIHYFKFVVNPASFSDTVENIFHVSFLINDGHAQIEMDNGEPMISPIEEKENANPEYNSVAEKDRKQMVVPMNMDLWEDLILVHDIKTAMI